MSGLGEQVNWIDGLLLLLLLLFVLSGLLRGAAFQLLHVAAVVCALLATALAAPRLAGLSFLDGLRRVHPDAPDGVAYLSFFAIVAIGLAMAVSWLCRRLSPRRKWKLLDRAVGAVLGAVTGVLVAGGISIGLLSWRTTAESAPFRDSVLAPVLAEGCQAVVLLVPERTRRNIREYTVKKKREVEERLRLADPPPGDDAPPPRRADGGDER